MTAIQIYALIALIVLAGLLVWAGYFMGHNDGKSAGMKESDAIQRAESAKTIRELRASLDFIKADHAHLAQFSKHLQQALALGEPERQALVDIAEKLRIAAETFAAFRTGKKLERETRALRDQALAIAALLELADQESRMRKICFQSNTHSSPDDSPPKADETTRNRIPKESGMKEVV
jgi:hypothetical protein